MDVYGFNNDNRQAGIVNNGAYYDYLPCLQVGRPDFYAVIKTDSTITLANRQIVVAGACSSTGGDLKIPFWDIVGPVIRRNCSTAAKKKVSLVCTNVSCADNLNMGITIVKPLSQCNTNEREWPIFKNWESTADCDSLTCAQKIAAFVAHANAQYEIPVVFSQDNGNTSRIFIEARVAGEDFDVKGFEGLGTYTVAVNNGIASYYGKDFKTWAFTTDCLPTVCQDDKCYSTVLIPFMAQIRNDRDWLGGSNPGHNNSGSYYGAMKTVMLIFDKTVTAISNLYDELNDILDGSKNFEDYVNVWTSEVTPTPVAPAPSPAPVAPSPTPTPVAAPTPI